ncbi:CHAT domain-containing protein [Mycena capillaripes]|nr:CHAT domain-containing protein [Mycena capillaripes]
MGNSVPVRHDAIRRLNLQATTSTALHTSINLFDLHAAVEILEQGLAIIYQQMLQLKTEADGLPPDQATRFLDLSSQICSGTFSNLIGVVEDRNRLLKEIRQQKGFEYFLLPKSYSVLCHASREGPVVILTSHKDRCDAIILLNPTSNPAHLPLPTFTLEHGISNGRLWWLPTSAFTGLPLHACSPTDEFIHSYTPTLGSLIDAYAKKPSSTPPKLAIIGVTYTDSAESNLLKGVEPEVKKIMSIVKQLDVQCHMGKQATVDAVKLQLQDCSWVHFAGHGHQDLVDPTKSHLQLYEGNLELETILRMPLSNAQFVFLAASQTTMGDAALVNESFHLGGGFIAAGFRSVIGTMWSMDDDDGPTIAEVVYSHLFREGQQPQASDTAEALHLAVKELKKQNVPYERWVPFIHIGV